MSKIDSTKYSAQVSNASSGTVISSTIFKNFIADVKDVVDKNSPEGTYGADAESTDAYAVTLDPAPTAYFTGMVVKFKANTVNTGAATLNVNSLGAKSIVKSKDNTLDDGDIKSGQLVTVVYDGTNFQMQSTPSTLSTNRYLNSQSLINGNFNGWQRGTSFSAPATSTYTSDQWKASWSNGGGTFPTLTHARQALTPGDIVNAFYGYRITTDGAGTGLGTAFYQLTQPIEFGTRLLCGAGKKVTVSFWAKSSISGKKIGVDLLQKYGTGGSPSADETINGNNFTLTSSWQKFTCTFTTNTLVGKTFGTNNNDHLLFEFWYVWGTNTQTRVGASTTESFVGSGTIDISQVTLNQGDAALPFQPMNFNDELIQWQRFYEKSYAYATAPATAATAAGLEVKVVPSNTIASNQIYGKIPFKVKKRTSSPVITVYPYSTPANTGRVSNPATGADLAASSGSLTYTGDDGFAVTNGTGGAITTGDSAVIFHWAAEDVL